MQKVTSCSKSLHHQKQDEYLTHLTCLPHDVSGLSVEENFPRVRSCSLDFMAAE